MKSELMRNVFLGSGSRLARYVRNDSSRQMVKESVAHLRDGGVLLLFPEGTRTTRVPINPLVGSVGLIAKHANVPVQTLVIETDSPFLSKGWPLFRRPELPITYKVRLGSALRPSGGCRRLHRGTRSLLPAGSARRAAIALAQARTMTPSSTHLVLIPSYNPGARCLQPCAALGPMGSRLGGGRRQHRSFRARLSAMAAAEPNLRVLVLPQNRGKGAAVLFGMREARALGFTHALTMDSDGQHPAEHPGSSCRHPSASPDAMVLGSRYSMPARPACGSRAEKYPTGGPISKRLWAGIHDSLFGFRVYPIGALIGVMRRQPWMRRFDFDVEAVVRLCWRGVRPINMPAPVRYFGPRRAAFRISATGATTCC